MEREYGVIPVTHYRVIVKGETFYYTRYMEIGDGYAKVMKNDRWGVIDNKGGRVCPVKYKALGELVNNMMTIYDGYRYGYFSKETGVVSPCIYEMAYPFEGEKAKVIYGGKTRFVNKKLEFVD